MIIFITIFILIFLLVYVILQLNNHLTYNGGNNHLTYNGGNNHLTYKIYPDFITGKNNDKFNNQLYPRKIYKHLIDRLNVLNWQESHDNNYVDFVFSLSNQQDHKIKANLKYGIKGVNNLYKKDILYKLGSKLHIPHTEDLITYKWCNDIVIVKEVLSYGQKGVYVIIDEHKFIKLKSQLKKRAIVSTYIKNPLLFKGKKFHLRVLICIFIDSSTNAKKYKISYMKKMITMKTASKPYKIEKKEDYLDPEMNITGGAMCDDLYMWPEDFQKNKHNVKYTQNHNKSNSFIQKCEKSIHDAVNSIPLREDIISLYDEQKAGFFIYAADILLDDTGHAWILELNKKPQHIPKIVEKKSISFQEKYRNNYFKYLFDWLLDDFILPYFAKLQHQ